MNRSFRHRWALSLGSLMIATGHSVVIADDTVLADAESDLLLARSIDDPIWQFGTSSASVLDDFHRNMLESLPVRQRVDRALGMVINQVEGAAEYVIEQSASWHDQFEYDEKLRVLLSPALSSPRLEVRMAAFEIYLASFSLEKSAAQIDELMGRFASEPEARPWAIWSVGLIAARGAERRRAFDEIQWQLLSEDPEIRVWAVNALGILGGVEVITPLLDIAGSDDALAVRERAFCQLATAATLHLSERYRAIPGLLDLAALDGQPDQVRLWVFQALREITEMDLDDNLPAWQQAMHDGLLLQQ